MLTSFINMERQVWKSKNSLLRSIFTLQNNFMKLGQSKLMLSYEMGKYNIFHEQISIKLEQHVGKAPYIYHSKSFLTISWSLVQANFIYRQTCEKCLFFFYLQTKSHNSAGAKVKIIKSKRYHTLINPKGCWHFIDK